MASQTEIATLEKDLSKLKIKMLEKPEHAFIATVCFSLKHKFSNEIPTACTNGKEVFYNPDFMLGKVPSLPLEKKHQLFVMLHETWHTALGHCIHKDTRFRNYTQEKLNIAMDHVINNMLFYVGVPMPDWVYRDPKFRDMSTEEVYKALPDSSVINPDLADVKPPEGDSATAQAELEEILIHAQVQAQMNNGVENLPGELLVMIEKLLNPKIRWDTLLRKFFTAKAKSDYSWSKPNRRFYPAYYLPSTYSDSLGDMAMALDMSASVSDEETRQFVTDVHRVLKSARPTKLELLQFDTRVFQIDTIKRVEELRKIRFKGRGGTTIAAPLQWAKDNKPQVLVIFTDGYVGKVTLDPGIPVIWIIYDNPKFKAPFGKIIHYEL